MPLHTFISYALLVAHISKLRICNLFIMHFTNRTYTFFKIYYSMVFSLLSGAGEKVEKIAPKYAEAHVTSQRSPLCTN